MGHALRPRATLLGHVSEITVDPVFGARTAGLLGSPFGQGPRLVASALIPRTTRITRLSFTADGKTLLSEDDGWGVKQWDVASGKERSLSVKLPSSDELSSVALSPDGKTLAAGTWDGKVRLWDLASGREVRQLKGRHRTHSRCLAFSADGKMLASGSFHHGAIKVWDVTTGEEWTTLGSAAAGEDVTFVAFKENGKTLVSMDDETGQLTVKFWDLPTGRLRMCLRPRRATRGGDGEVAVTADGKTLACVAAPAARGICLYDLDVRREAVAFAFAPKELGVSISSVFALDGEQLLVAETDTARVRRWDVAGGGEQAAIPLQGRLGSSSAASVAGRVLASTDDSGSPTRASRMVVLWDGDTGKERLRLQPEGYWASNLVFSPSGRFLAYRVQSGQSLKVEVWDAVTRQKWAGPGWGSGVGALLGFSPDERTLVTAGEKVGVSLWELSTGKRRAHLPTRGKPPVSVAFDPSGRLLAVVGWEDATVRLWDLASGQERPALCGHVDRVSCVAFSPSGKTLASGAYDGEVKLWDIASGQERASLRVGRALIRFLAFTADGRRLVAVNYAGAVKVWESSPPEVVPPAADNSHSSP
jgi:WD40 repeat protein